MDIRVQDIADISSERLYSLFGDEILSESRMGVEVDDDQKSNLAKNWFENKSGEIKKVVCQSNLVKDLAEEGDTLNLIAAISPLIGFAPTASAATIAAVIITRKGVRNLCASEWND